jgi:GNAT superfamily N-acetyltransferase
MHCESSGWDTVALKEMQERFAFELKEGGMGIGAFKEERLVGFGVLGHAFIGAAQDQLQVDLLYVSRNYRKRGIGKTILQMIGEEAKKRGAKALYISSAETTSAVSFYMGNGAAVTDMVDEMLFKKEPKDIHMVKKLE